ncbi:MAG: hypothetical protein FWH29_10895 [Methanobrevibacter sp.]|nr:hypothetical protein [Methanobrevibacter sp.]
MLIAFNRYLTASFRKYELLRYNPAFTRLSISCNSMGVNLVERVLATNFSGIFH